MSNTWSTWEEFEREFPAVREARERYDQAVREEMEFRAYLDGLLALPSETVRILKEMEQEKRREG